MGASGTREGAQGLVMVLDQVHGYSYAYTWNIRTSVSLNSPTSRTKHGDSPRRRVAVPSTPGHTAPHPMIHHAMGHLGNFSPATSISSCRCVQAYQRLPLFNWQNTLFIQTIRLLQGRLLKKGSKRLVEMAAPRRRDSQCIGSTYLKVRESAH